eukprot:Nitzschia sp. Nitz4//scaffold3_size479765//204454//204839//NITZ4_000086-RA/size479765-processed-gene-1.283-mRNA-1//-1//CDS//3329550716//6440//frame0
MDKVKEGTSKAFSAGLGKGGRVAAWVVAIGAVATYTYMENRGNGTIFSQEEQMKWNTNKKSSDGSSFQPASEK